MKNVEKIINGITIMVDQKVELIGLLLTLSDENEKFPYLFEFNENNDLYIRNLKEKFNYVRKYDIFKKFLELRDKYYWHYDKPIEMMLSLDDNFEFKKESNYKFKDVDEIKMFCKDLKILYEQINFLDFYNSHRETYEKWIDAIKLVYEKNAIKKSIVAYCGKGYDDYKFYTTLIPFETGGGYGVLLERSAHNCLRARKNTHDNILFFVENDKVYLSTSIHEYLHSIINPLTYKYDVFNQETKYLFDEQNMIRGYANDFSMVNETIIRAMTIRIYHFITDLDEDEGRLANEEKQGFKYVRVVYEKLLEYENMRDRYVDIDSYYLEIASSILANLQNF